MNFQKIIVPAAALAVFVLAYRFYGWPGIAAAFTGGVMWVLLNFTKALKVLRVAAKRPVGFFDSAVMLNVKLKPRMTLMHVVAMTGALGERLSDKDVQPEIYRWTDEGLSHVTCTFVSGKLAHHELYRPPAEDEGSGTTEEAGTEGLSAPKMTALPTSQAGDPSAP